MNSITAEMTVVEVSLWGTIAVLFHVRGLHRRLPMTGTYLVFRTVCGSFLLVMLNFTVWGEKHRQCDLYSFTDSAVHIVNAFWMFFICIEVLRFALRAFPEASKLMIVVFRWAAAVSVILCLISIFSVNQGFYSLAEELRRLAAMIELCLWAFLYMGIHALRPSRRDMMFGISLGAGIMAASDFVCALGNSRVFSTTASVQFISESFMLIALGIWIVYCLLPDSMARLVLLPASSTIYRWNEIGRSLGHAGTKIVVEQPAKGIFLSDVERVLDESPGAQYERTSWPRFAVSPPACGRSHGKAVSHVRFLSRRAQHSKAEMR